VAERGDKLVTRCRRKATELNRRPITADRADPNRLLVGENADKAVEIRQSLVVIIGIAHAGNRLPQLILFKAERSGAHDVGLEPVRVAVEDLLLADEGIWIGESR